MLKQQYGAQPYKANSGAAYYLNFIILIALISTFAVIPAGARGTHIKHGATARVFIMAGFHPDTCAFLGFPEMQIDAAPTKGQVTFKPGETTTVQYSLSGNCIGIRIEGTGIYYTPSTGAKGEDSFTVTGRIGQGEPATRTFSIVIEE